MALAAQSNIVALYSYILFIVNILFALADSFSLFFSPKKLYIDFYVTDDVFFCSYFVYVSPFLSLLLCLIYFYVFIFFCFCFSSPPGSAFSYALFFFNPFPFSGFVLFCCFFFFVSCVPFCFLPVCYFPFDFSVSDSPLVGCPMYLRLHLCWATESAIWWITCLSFFLFSLFSFRCLLAFLFRLFSSSTPLPFTCFYRVLFFILFFFRA